MDGEGDQAELEFAVELAALALEKAAPEELELFDEAAEEYFADPDAATSRSEHDEPLAFGGEILALAPFVLAVAVPVVKYLAGILLDGVKDAASPAVGEWLQSLVRRKGERHASDAPDTPVLTVEEGQRVRHIALDKLRTLQVPDDQARLIADSVVGALLLPAEVSAPPKRPA